MTDGETMLIDVELEKVTLAAGTVSTTLLLVGVLPDSWTRLTLVVPLVNPVPLIVSEVPPVMEPETGFDDGLVLRPVTAGMTGDQSQLSMVMPVPQYVTHCAVVGALITEAG
jgi:hypothetical protein